MNWEAIGAIAELLGAIGVIGSLGYLASQIRSSNRLARSGAKLAAATQFSSFLDNLIAHPDLNEIWVRGHHDLAGLKDEERARFDNLAMKAFYFFSAQHFQYRTGTLEEGEWMESYRLLIWWLGGRGVREWWQRRGRQLATDLFRHFVEDEIRNLSNNAGSLEI